jgi:hypothetical protein
MSPSPASIARVRYWIVVGLRLAAGAMIVLAAIQSVGIVSPVARYELAERGSGAGHMQIGPVLVDLTFGPLVALVGAFAAVRWGPALARWIAPMPKAACPDCGYAAAKGVDRCPECGLALTPGAR